MGSAQSSHAKNTKAAVTSVEKEQPTRGVRGRKSPSFQEFSEPTDRTESVEDEERSLFESEEEEVSMSEGDVDEEEDEELERAFVMEDAFKLKLLAEMFLHPERSVKVDATAMARCFFDRPSAPERETVDESEERARIFDDAATCKRMAVDYAHPEKTVVVSDPTACARCFFSRPTAPEQETVQEAEERAKIIEDVQELEACAYQYMHPEALVHCSDPFACGRNFFSRASCAEQESLDEIVERAFIMQEVSMLKKYAVDFFHPELPAVTTDATACGRNYFDRPSAPERTDVSEGELAHVMSDVSHLKQAALDFLHPELPLVTSDSTSCGRNYFERLSAPEQDDPDDEEERRRIMDDAAALKKLAVHYAHPELPVITTDPTAFGRNFFSRPSAPQELLEEVQERDRILADVTALKAVAVDYLHPEVPVVTSDPAACGRNYFERPSAPEQDDQEIEDMRQQILVDSLMLKKLAVDYAHPELPVAVTDPTAFGRNFFMRPSAPGQIALEEAQELGRILEDAFSLKKLAIDFLHPELPVAQDFAAGGRNYYDRFSAFEQESVEEAEERVSILSDAAALKKLAVDFMHPELPVITSDPAACGRNYFSRLSAPVQESLDATEDWAQCLAEASALKKSATDFAHPELPCTTMDPTSFGRNYFNRPSAPGHAERIHTMGYENTKQETGSLHDDSSHQEHHDHFEMDEDIFFDRDSFRSMSDSQANVASNDIVFALKKSNDEDEEGKLSRSPSSVMLFEQGLEGY